MDGNAPGLDRVTAMFPYRSKAGLADALGISKSTVHVRTAEMQKMARDRYGDYAVIREGQIVLVNALAFIDWMRYRRELLDRNLAKHVPPYDPEALAKSMGWKIEAVSLRRPKVC